MNIMSPIRRLARRINRMRLRMAESDLAFLEARAPIVIQQQRQRVAELRIATGLNLHRVDANAVRLMAEHRQKRALLG